MQPLKERAEGGAAAIYRNKGFTNKTDPTTTFYALRDAWLAGYRAAQHDLKKKGAKVLKQEGLGVEV